MLNDTSNDILNNMPDNLVLKDLPKAWQACLSQSTLINVLPKLSLFLENELKTQIIYPPQAQWFNVFKCLDIAQVKVVIIGQDPYHGEMQGNGIAFGVNHGIKIPPSLRNIFKELHSDLNIKPSLNGDLTPWVKQGVLLLNTVLTVRKAAANSHKNQGWEEITGDVIHTLAQAYNPLIFVLWGNDAKKFKAKIAPRHCIIESSHPSPLSARRGFLGSKVFSKINSYLFEQNRAPINWDLDIETKYK